jgi:hypothetical protein
MSGNLKDQESCSWAEDQESKSKKVEVWEKGRLRAAGECVTLD